MSDLRIIVAYCGCYQASGPAPPSSLKPRTRHKTHVDMEDVHQAALVRRHAPAPPLQVWASQQQIEDHYFLPSENSNHMQHVNNHTIETTQGHRRRDCSAQVTQEDLEEQRHHQV